MIDFAFMLVTYKNDYLKAMNLIQSFNRYNCENLNLFIVTSPEDIEIFKELESDTITIMDRSSIPVKFANESMENLPNRSGYLNQEIVKLAFWELKICKNYLCLDSDGEFLKNFYKRDFMFNSEEPYTIAVNDFDLKADPEYYVKFWIDREKSIRKIYDAFKLNQPSNIKTCHGFQIMSSRYLKKLKTDFMEVNKYDYLDLLLICGYEFSWYTIFLQSLDEKIHFSEPQFKTFHTSNQYLISKFLGIRKEDWANSYIGIVVNGNFQPKNKQIDANSSIAKLIGYYVETRVILYSLLYKIPFLYYKIKHLLKEITK